MDELCTDTDTTQTRLRVGGRQPAPSTTSRGRQFGDYRILEPIARGGMGMVYRAWQVSLERVVALKVIAAEQSDDPTYRERFRTEVLTAAVVEHPHVVPVYDAGEVAGRQFLAMRLIVGSDLRCLLRWEGRLSAGRAIRIVGQLADALTAAHSLGIVHRDVKPSNVLMTRTTAGDHAYLADFGVARRRARGTGGTESLRCAGTLGYIAPEVLQGATADARSDIYSLGCLLFALLTGRTPFKGRDDAATIRAHICEPAPRLGLPGPIGARLDRVIGRALAKAPEERFARAIDLAADAQAAVTTLSAIGDEPTRPAVRTEGPTLPPVARREDLRVVTVTGPGANCETHVAVEQLLPDGARSLRLLGEFDPFAALEIELRPPDAEDHPVLA
jgi:serine/threonine protein kinase